MSPKKDLAKSLSMFNRIGSAAKSTEDSPAGVDGKKVRKNKTLKK